MDIADPDDGVTAAAHGVVQRREVLAYIEPGVFERKRKPVSSTPRYLFTRLVILTH
ncbi:hypothetical protein KOI35_26630 [Actinoplanes bogorensis]|uniref:Uncharacterized protein n=1 Tax=Paractinoplanes bogorensis TaxID=1610840 RepID=A0ABS5YUP0_9ACTN|nr:hypothetical protein [Actinoplanes bogorensis]MBU2667088.1 hypothetical protein [Actinoplanes bogorensis]